MNLLLDKLACQQPVSLCAVNIPAVTDALRSGLSETSLSCLKTPFHSVNINPETPGDQDQLLAP